MKPSQLALFDLDQTLLPIDSDSAWGRFLVEIGAVDKEIYPRAVEKFYMDYLAGCLDIQQYLRFALAPLALHSREQLNIWRAQFVQQVIMPVLHPAAYALINEHRQANRLCAIVTATNSFITRPIADVLGIEYLIATEPATVNGDPDGAFTGEVSGQPSYHEGKVIRTEAWLAELGLRWSDFEQSYFYSDSIVDSPLLEKVSIPIATNPAPNLRALAQEKGWQILELFRS